MCNVNYSCKLCSFGARIVYLRFLIGRLSMADVAIYPQGKLSEYTDTFTVHLFGNRVFVCRVSSIQFTPTLRSVMSMKSLHVLLKGTAGIPYNFISCKSCCVVCATSHPMNAKGPRSERMPMENTKLELCVRYHYYYHIFLSACNGNSQANICMRRCSK